MFLYHIRRLGMPLSEGYIGVTVNTTKRFSQHIRDSKNERRLARNTHLYSALNKYDDIEFVVLEEGDREYILKREFELRPKPFIGWNQSVGGSGYGGNIFLGKKRPEHSEKMKIKGFQKGNSFGDQHPIMAAGFIFINKKVASSVLGINSKTVYNRCKSELEGYKFLRNEINELI